MSQSKTVIQGLEPADFSHRSQGEASANLYSRQGRPGKGTVVPGLGMTERPSSKPKGTMLIDNSEQQIGGRPITMSKPIVGFLYSVSRSAAGEYWPLQIGQNTIGQSPSCHVVLPEGTVSSEHAVLVVRKMKNPGKVIASISDARSTNGTMLNGVSLGFSAEECHNGDIITIGDNYDLLLILVDTEELGLKPVPNFIPVEMEDVESGVDDLDIPQGFTRPGGANSFNSFSPDFNGYTPSRGTVGLDGSSDDNRGGTIGM